MPDTQEVVINTSPIIQLALNQNIQTVVIDEVAGRRIARLNGLSVTGSIGILLRAQREGYQFSKYVRIVIDRPVHEAMEK